MAAAEHGEKHSGNRADAEGGRVVQGPAARAPALTVSEGAALS